MKIITVSGPPSCGKTSVILRLSEYLRKEQNMKIGAVKFDCLSNTDKELYDKAGIPIKVGLSVNLCPDHYFITNIEECVQWGIESGLDLLISESAGLCNRCSPHIKDILAICVVDNLSGIHTPQKIGPMLKLADIVVVTKADVVSQAEREVFVNNVRKANPRASVLIVNGITGQGIFPLIRRLRDAKEYDSVTEMRLRFTMPSSLCAYCTGQTRIGKQYQMGNIRKMDFSDDNQKSGEKS